MPPLRQQYQIDQTTINKTTIQSLISQSQNTNPSTTIQQVFNLCDKLVEYDENPNDKEVKMVIKYLVQKKFTNKQLQTYQQQTLKQYRIKPMQVFLINKPGNFGRVLQRKCRIVQKGLMEYQQGKQAKLKEIKSFLNKIQHVQNKQLTDLAWLSISPELYKFRIILYDMNQNNKGIYFQTYQEAQSVRAYLVYKYKKPTINNQVFSALKYKLMESTVNGLVEKIKYRSLIKKISQSQKPKMSKEIEDSSNNSEIKFSGGKEIRLSFNSKAGGNQQQSNYQQRESQIMMSKKEQPTAKKNYMTGFLDDLINQHNKSGNLKLIHEPSEKSIIKSRVSVKNKGAIFQRFNQACRNDFFFKWREFALKKKSRFPSTNKIINENQYQKSRITNNQQVRTSRKVQSSLIQNKQQKPLSGMSPFNQFDDYEESQENPFALPITINGQNVSSVESSPIKQSSRINKVLAHSRKQESIFKIPQRIQQQQSMEENEQFNKNKMIGTQKILFKSVEFMDHSLLGNSSSNKENSSDINKDKTKNNTNPNLLLFKPIITLTIHKHKKKQQPSKMNKQKQKNARFRIQQQQNHPHVQERETKKGQYIFNTMIKKSYRTMEYELVPTEGDGLFETGQSMNNMYIMLTVTNFLTNEEILQCMFQFSQFAFVRYGNTIVDKQSKMRMKFEYQSTGVAQPQAVYNNNQNSQSSLFFSIPKIDPQIIKKIKTYWQSQAISNSYYNLQDNFNIFDAVSNSSNEAQPMNWWIDLDEKEYNYLCILNSSSVILGYKLCKPMLYLIKAVKNIHFKIQKIMQMLLSIILNLGNYYYFPQNLNKVNYLHRQVGLSNGNIDFQNRIFFQVLLFEKFLAFQCPELNEKLQRKNIAISHLMLEYTYELFSRNFSIEVLCEYWSYCVEEMQKVPLIFFLTTISLCRLLGQKLLRCNRLAEIREIFQSKKIRSSVLLLNEIKQLRVKYFSKGEGFIEEIKQAFEQKPFENVLNIYYKRLSDNEARMKRDNVSYKHQLCSKVLQQVQPQQALELFTKYARQPKKYTLHIYFYQLPQTQGKFIICTGQSKYESLTVNKNRYFIVGQVSSKVQIKFIDYRGNDFHGQLVMNQGFNQFKIKLVSEKSLEEYELHYLCGLLTDTQIEMIKANKKFSHFMGPNITLQLFKDELLRPLKQVRHSESWMTQEWFRDLRVIFSHGNKLFSQVGYFMNLLISENITHDQKLSKIRQFSIKISQQYFLCDNHIVYKQLLYEFYKMTFIPLKQQDFQCYFNDSVQLQFQAPKILKCRFVTQTKQIKLEKQINQYWSKKCFTHLYGDMFVDQILSVCQKHIKAKMSSSLSDGELKILYSTFGNIELKVIPLKIQNKKLLIDYEKQSINESVFHQIALKQPELLMTEILPSFTKISTILDFVNSSRNIDLRTRSRETMEKKVIPETINLLKYAQNRMKNCLLLRYGSFPSHVKIPFYCYFSELTMNPEIPKFKHYYFNNVKDSIKSICLSKEQLRFSSNNKEQDQEFDKSVGLYGNLRKLLKFGGQINTVFFWTESKEDQSIPKSLVWTNYGYGVGRWQSCIIKQYRKMLKRRNKNSRTPRNKNEQNNKNNKIQYLVQKGQMKFYARDYQVKINPAAKEHLTQRRNELEKEFLQTNNDIKSSLSFLLNPNQLSGFVKQINKQKK